MTITNITSANNTTFIIFIISMIKLVRDSINITFNITIMTMIMLSLAFRDGKAGVRELAGFPRVRANDVT